LPTNRQDGRLQPEIVYEGGRSKKWNPRDDDAIARVNASMSAKFVSVKDGINVPVIAAFRLLGEVCRRGIRSF